MRRFNSSIVRIRNTNGEFEPLSALRGYSSYELAVKNGFVGSEAEWMESIIGDGWIGAFQELEAKVTALEEPNKIVVHNTTIEPNMFVIDRTYTDYPYRASIDIENVTTTMIPEIIFSVNDANSGVFAPVAETYDGCVCIYAVNPPVDVLTIPTIIIWR